MVRDIDPRAAPGRIERPAWTAPIAEIPVSSVMRDPGVEVYDAEALRFNFERNISAVNTSTSRACASASAPPSPARPRSKFIVR